MAGAGLFEMNRLALAFGTDDNRLEVEEVAIVAFVVEGFDVDHAFAFIDVHFGGEVGVLDSAQAPLADLGPKLAVLVPVEPELAPLGLGIGSEGDGAAKAVLPVSEERIVFVGEEGSFGPRFGGGGNVAKERGILVGADAADKFGLGLQTGFEGIFINGGLENDGGFLDENLWEFVGLGDVVESAFSFVGHHDHGVGRGMAGDQHGADSDAVADDGLHESGSRRAGIAIAEDNDVLEVGMGFLKRLMGHFENVLETAEVALIHAGDFLAESFFVADLLEVEEPMFVAIPKDDAHFVIGPESRENPLGAIASDLVAIAEFHAVHDENDRPAGKDLLAVEFHADRQGGFERRIAVTASGVGLIAADTNETDTEIAHGAFEELHSVRAKITGSDVADKDGIVTLHFGEAAGEPAGGNEFDFKASGLKGLGQLLVLVGIG